ncbi:hypothetical protein [Oceanobacillus senegalensis]|uniref:hypothetical protein n=1 Tax=Oceanobacillus senegalensis TaxID=1936063 RepID=UPI000A30E8F3|nr:hypothetical protein [Oceanobacillus senegalensis]
MAKDSKGFSDKQLVKEIHKIKVTKPEDTGMVVHNPTDLSVISHEEKRVVIGIDKNHCAAYFEKEEKAEKEFKSLQLGAKQGITPTVYGRKGTYVVMEPIDAPTVADYLKENTITKEFTKKLLKLLNDFKAVGYTRLDQSPEYIYLMPDGSFKVVNVHRHTKIPGKEFPQRLIKGMGKQAPTFLKYVEELDSDLYKKWTKHPKFQSTVDKAKLRG